MKRIVIVIVLLVSFAAHAQVISRFTWASSPLTTAAQGPNGTSVSSSAFSEFVGGTVGYAINPGLPTANVDLTIPGSPTFDINSIDIALDFRREEGVASFFKRGANFDFGSNGGYLTITFTTTQGSTPGNLTINSGNIVAIADDHLFHHYRFIYDNSTGIGKMWVDNVVVYTYNGVAGRPLAWVTTDNVIIGQNMDATSRNIAVLGNMTIQIASSAMLPVNLLSFSATKNNENSLLEWSATNESSLSFYSVERSKDGVEFNSMKNVTANHASASDSYTFLDESPFTGSNYYRLKMIDRQGNFTFSNVKEIRVAGNAQSAKCYPNPAKDFVYVGASDFIEGTYQYGIFNLQGNVLATHSYTLQANDHLIKIDLPTSLTTGTYIIRIYNKDHKPVGSFTVLKKG